MSSPASQGKGSGGRKKNPSQVQQTLKDAGSYADQQEVETIRSFIKRRYQTANLEGSPYDDPSDEAVTEATVWESATHLRYFSNMAKFARVSVREALWKEGFLKDAAINKERMEDRHALWAGKIFTKTEDIDIEESKFIEYEDELGVIVEKFNLCLVLLRLENGMWVLVLGTRQDQGTEGLADHIKARLARVVSSASSPEERKSDGTLPTLVLEGREDVPRSQIVEPWLRFVRYDEWMKPTEGNFDKDSMALAIRYVENAQNSVISRAMSQNGLGRGDLDKAQKKIAAAEPKKSRASRSHQTNGQAQRNQVTQLRARPQHSSPKAFDRQHAQAGASRKGSNGSDAQSQKSGYHDRAQQGATDEGDPDQGANDPTLPKTEDICDLPDGKTDMTDWVSKKDMINETGGTSKRPPKRPYKDLDRDMDSVEKRSSKKPRIMSSPTGRILGQRKLTQYEED